MSLDPSYKVSVNTPAAGDEDVNQVFPGYPLYNGGGTSFLLVLMGTTTADGALRWYFAVHDGPGTPYDPDPVRFLQINADPSDPVGPYAAENSSGAPDSTIGTGSVEEIP